jgi:hypothetical protein
MMDPNMHSRSKLHPSISRALWFLALTTSAFGLPKANAEDVPVAVLAKKIGGHIHPSICMTKKGTLLVVFKGNNVLMCSRSTDQGKTWSVPSRIKTSAMRPDSIRKAPRFEVYPGTADTLPDGRVLVTWNYIADDKNNDGYYERALLYSISKDDGRSWSEQQLIGPVEGKHLGAVRHNVLPWSDGHWLLPLRTGMPRLFHPATGTLRDFRVAADTAAKKGKQHEFQQITRTSTGALLAMGPELLHSNDDGKNWQVIKDFPVTSKSRDNLEGRYLTALTNGGALVTWGIGQDNKGLRYTYSSDGGLTWNQKSVTVLPNTHVIARYYSARTIQLDEAHIGSVFMNPTGIYFMRVALERLTH